MRHFLRRLGQLPYLLGGRTAFETPAYREAGLARLANLFAHADVERWAGYRVLEVGAGLGQLGDGFRHLGFQVTSSDGRAEHVEKMRAMGKEALVLTWTLSTPGSLQATTSSSPSASSITSRSPSDSSMRAARPPRSCCSSRRCWTACSR